MATRKTKNATETSRSGAQVAATERRSSRRPVMPVTNTTDLTRLLREAAWSRMFGRVESKNPFAR